MPSYAWIVQNLPPFNDEGDLPPGVHRATLAETMQRFGEGSVQRRAVGERLGAQPERLFVNVDRYGNTSAASVAIALDEAVQTGRVTRGDLVLLVVFGAGLTWAAAIIEW
jgi:3-hydroxy-3-methylglutaryl CoA synthase